MSTPDNRSVNFFSLFRRGQHYAKTWPMEKRLAPVFVENRVIRMNALCHTIYAACRRLYIMLADSAGRSVRPGRGDRSVRPELAHAGIMVVRETFRDAIAAFNPQLVLRSSR